MNAIVSFVLIAFLLDFSVCNSIPGCMGYVKANSQIKLETKPNFANFSLTLIGTDGSIKSTTECMPNGYYFIPIYESGTFLLSLDEVDGFTVLPTQLTVSYDGNEVVGCADGTFEIMGFSVSGWIQSKSKIVSKVEIQLVLSGKVVESVVANEEGGFVFSTVIPDNYEVKVVHPTWIFEKSSQKISVPWGGFNISTPFVISGFNVFGRILNSGKGMEDIAIEIVSTDRKNRCYNANSCITKTTKDGKYTLSPIPVGAYTLKPTTTEILIFSPSSVDVVVKNDDVHLEDISLSSLKVKGRVLGGNKPLQDVSILSDKTHLTFTNTDGEYEIDITPVSHTFVAKKQGFEFTPITFAPPQLIPPYHTIPSISDITVKSVELCGNIIFEFLNKDVLSKVKLYPRNVNILNLQTKETTVIKSDQNGHFCHQLLGKYEISVSLSRSEILSGLTLSPPKHSVVVLGNERPPPITFNSLMSSLTVHHQSFPESRSSILNIKSVDLFPFNEDYILTDSQFNVTDLVPGKYEISIQDKTSGFCYGQSKTILSEYPTINPTLQTITLLPDKNLEITFVQSGYILSLSCETNEDIRIINKEHAISQKYQLKTEIPLFLCSQMNLVYIVTPQSDTQYINSNYLLSYAKNNIKLELSPIDDIRTLVLVGKVTPPLADVKVSAIDKSDNSLIYPNVTNKLGHFTIGPLYNSREYTLIAEKIGYIFTLTNNNEFVYRKTGSIQIEVFDQDKVALSQVLISLSSDNYFDNQYSNDQGSYVFNGLNPGEYFIKVNLIEYKFTPSYASFNVKEGINHHHVFTGVKYAFSCFGRITAINANSVKDVTVLASGKDGTKYNSVSDNSGYYRLRGLTPKVEYTISIQRNILYIPLNPTSYNRTIDTDLKNINFIVLPNKMKHTIFGALDSNLQDYSHLRIELYRQNQLSPFKIVEPTVFHTFSFKSIPSDDYILKVTSTIEPEIDTVVNASIINFSLLNSTTTDFQLWYHIVPQTAQRLSIFGILLYVLILALIVGYLLYPKIQYYKEISAKKMNQQKEKSN